MGEQSRLSKVTSNSRASKMLRRALAAAQQMGEGKQKYNESYISGVLSSLVKKFDLRSSIFAVFYRVGRFEVHELSSEEKQVMELVQLYPFLKNGEIW